MKNKYIGPKITILRNLIKRSRDEATSEHDITTIQSRILHFININTSKDDFVSQGDIEKYFDIRRSTATEILQKLESKELIKRKLSDIDKRQKEIYITEKGLESEKSTFNKIINYEEKLISVLTEEEIDSFFSIMDKLIEKAREEEEKNV